MNIHIQKLRINNSDSIGLFLYLNDDILLISNSIDNKKDILNIFKDIKIEYINYPIISPFILEFEDKIILSKNSPNQIIEVLNKYFDIIEIDTKENMLGNIFIINNNKLFFSRALKSDIKILKEKLGLEEIKINTIYPLGSISKIYKNKILIGDIPNNNKIRSIFEKNSKFEKIDFSTINFGSSYLRYGVILNKNYLITGNSTSGQEILKIKEFFYE